MIKSAQSLLAPEMIKSAHSLLAHILDVEKILVLHCTQEAEGSRPFWVIM